MRTIKCNSVREAESSLQEYVDGIWHDYPQFTPEHRRRWLNATPPDSYSDDQYRIELRVLEGSPVKLICIVNHYKKEIMCYNYLLEKQAKFSWAGEQHEE